MKVAVMTENSLCQIGRLSISVRPLAALGQRDGKKKSIGGAYEIE